MRTDQNPTAAYLGSLAKELAILADRNRLPVLAHLFRMAEMEATAANSAPAPAQPKRGIKGCVMSKTTPDAKMSEDDVLDYMSLKLSEISELAFANGITQIYQLIQMARFEIDFEKTGVTQTLERALQVGKPMRTS